MSLALWMISFFFACLCIVCVCVWRGGREGGVLKGSKGGMRKKKRFFFFLAFQGGGKMNINKSRIGGGVICL